jgi:hypothetical protein
MIKDLLLKNKHPDYLPDKIALYIVNTKIIQSS